MWALFRLVDKVGIVSVIQLGAMLAYLEFRISDTFRWSQGMLYRFEYSIVGLYACVRTHEACTQITSMLELG